jgi:hypothetical protein
MVSSFGELLGWLVGWSIDWYDGCLVYWLFHLFSSRFLVVFFYWQQDSLVGCLKEFGLLVE